MNAKINKEIRNYSESIFFGLSMRQFVFSLLAVLVAVGLYFLLCPYFGLETLSWMVILAAAPFAVMGFVSYHGMSAEQFLITWIRSELIEPRQLSVQVNNLYYEAMKNGSRQKRREGKESVLKTLRTLLSQDKEAYRVPRKVQDLIPIKRIWKDGIFLVGNKYTKCFCFTDINYMVAGLSEKEKMNETYRGLLNSLDDGITTKITINNHPIDQAAFEASVLMPMREDQRDPYRMEYNHMLLEKGVGANCVMQEKYVTVSVAKRDLEDARAEFARIGANLKAGFAALGSDCRELSTTERLQILHDFYRPGEEAGFHFNLKEMMRKGHDFRDYICSDSIEKHSDYMKLGNRYCRVLYLKDYASFIRDTLVTELADFNRRMMLSIDIIPIPKDEALREVQNRLLGIETNITNWQRRQNANNNFSAVVPYDMELQRTEATAYLNDLSRKDQRMMLGVITMVLTAETKKQLDQDTDAIMAVARKHMCQLAVLRFQQPDGLNTVLPIGARRINAFRTLTTESLAVFIPFKVQEILEHGGIFFGENAVSHNLIMVNRAKLMNQSALILGVPGSGKSFSAKELVTFLILNTDDDVLICDPEKEFAPLVEALGTDIGSVINVSAGGKDRINAMQMEDGYIIEGNPIAEKSQFIMSLLDQIADKEFGTQYKSIVDRCIKQIYGEAARTGVTPTLCTLREKLLEQPEFKAQELALTLELFTTGSLDAFGHESNVDLDKRVVVFNIRDLSETMKPAGLLVITDTILNRVTLNWKKGKRTHVFIDEFHMVFNTDQGAEFFTNAWRQFRKRNAYPTAITQNVTYLLDSEKARTMVSNSEMIVMLNQSAQDRDKLAELLNISDEQMRYVTNADPGCGLIRYGRSVVPFVNRFPKDTELYKLMTTKPGEGVFDGGGGGA